MNRKGRETSPQEFVLLYATWDRYFDILTDPEADTDDPAMERLLHKSKLIARQALRDAR